MNGMEHHYDILIFRENEMIDYFPKAYCVELDSCISFSYVNRSGVGVFITYPLDGLEMKIVYKGEY